MLSDLHLNSVRCCLWGHIVCHNREWKQKEMTSCFDTEIIPHLLQESKQIYAWKLFILLELKTFSWFNNTNSKYVCLYYMTFIYFRSTSLVLVQTLKEIGIIILRVTTGRKIHNFVSPKFMTVMLKKRSYKCYLMLRKWQYLEVLTRIFSFFSPLTTQRLLFLC